MQTKPITFFLYILLGALVQAPSFRVYCQDILAKDDAELLTLVNTDFLSPQELVARLEKLRTTTGLTEHLNKLLWEMGDAEENARYIGDILFALRQRKDMTPEQTSRLSNKLIQLTKKKSGEWSDLDLNFLQTGVRVLGNYPSPLHEQIALNLLAAPNDTLQENVVVTLQTIGTDKSLPALQELAERSKATPPEVNRLYDEILVATKAILQRRNVNKPESSLPSSATILPNSTLPQASTQTNNGSSVSVFTWLGVAIAATVAAVWLILRKSR